MSDFILNNASPYLVTVYWVLFWLSIALAIGGFFYIIYVYRKLKKMDNGTEEMQKIHNFILIGAKAYLKRQYKTISIVSAVIFVILLFVGYSSPAIKYKLAVSFIVGAFSSISASYISMISATMTNVKVTNASAKSINKALKIGFDSGMIIGVAVISISLFGIMLLYLIFDFSTQDILGYAFGASFAALFAQLGGGIFTKGADVSADIVGKLENGLPEDDYRNPAAIADNVGDNVGDCAGRGADLFESSSANNIGAMVIGVILSAATQNPLFIIFSLISRGLGNVAAIIGGHFVNMKDEDDDPIKALFKGIISSAVISMVFYFILILLCFPNGFWLLAICAGVGTLLGISTYLIVNYYTSSRFRPVKSVIQKSETGAATNVIGGFALGLESTAIPVITFVVGILLCFYLGTVYASINGVQSYIGGVFGLTIATVSLLSMTTIILAADGFGPVSDNAAGIAEMAHLGPDVRRNLDRLDAVGNTTKALAKGFGMTSAALSAIILYEAFLEETHTTDVNIYYPVIVVSILIGALIPFLFSSLAINATGGAAYSMIKEIQKQFSDNPGILEGSALPDYAKVIDIATAVSLKKMIAPALLAVLSPLAIGFFFGPEAVAAFLIAGTVSGILLGFLMNTGGGALDNAKKAIEGGLLGGKGSIAHGASIVGDTFGDPLKDTAGPSLHILIKVFNTISIAFAGIFLAYGGLMFF